MTPGDKEVQELKQLIRDQSAEIRQLRDELPRLYVSRMDFEQRQETLENTTQLIREKLDALSTGLPDRFLDRAQYLIAHSALEKRMETAEVRHEDLRKEVAVEKQRVSDMYSTGMQRINDTFTSIRTLITETRDLVQMKNEAIEKQLNEMQINELQRDQDQAQRDREQRKQLKNQIRVVLLSVFCGAILAFVSTLLLHAIHVL